MKTNLLILAIIFILNISKSGAQEIIGFWEIKNVMVGEKDMTPVAKWTKINKDQTYQSGNDWLQHSRGKWIYDIKTKQFLPKEKFGIEDEYDAFTVSFLDGSMIWERVEDGMVVVVSLEKIEELPMSKADELIGLWDLNKAIKEEEVITYSSDPDDMFYIFIRWDRVYVQRSSQAERSTGCWHIHGHRPEITLISHKEKTDNEKWRVEVNDSELRLFGISDENKRLE